MNNSTRLAAIYDQVPAFECRGLCSQSCGPIVMTAYEQRRLEASLGRRPEIAGIDCPALVGERCAAYDARPIICRLWGAVEELACPHGCRPEVWLSDAQARALLAEVRRISPTIVSIDRARCA